ncbi:MAG: hypothetical protein AAFV43_01480 [Planctomycetota bacterium]
MLRATLCLLTILAAGLVEAQLPFATGRQVAMSRSQWRMFIPDTYTHRPGDEVDLLVHFHGDSQTVWNNAAYADLNAVIVTVNYNGLSSAYRVPFQDTTLFDQLLTDAENRLRGQTDFGAAASFDTLAVSSFSAGYGAVREIVKSPTYRTQIDSLLAADSLYATTASDGTPLDSQMAGYKAYADLAAAGDKRFIFTHSQVATFGYESTEETGNELLQHLSLGTATDNGVGLGTLRYYRKAEQEGFTLHGARGATGDDHLAHLRYMGEWLGDLGLATRPPLGDFNADGRVDIADYTTWRDGMETGDTSIFDYGFWYANFGTGVGGNAVSVPEVGAITLLGCLSVGLVSSSRRRPR